MIYLIGLFSGVIGGMGIGGGVVLIPALVILTNISQQSIQSINLLYFIPTAIIALIVHIKNNYINFKITLGVLVFGIIGSIIGSNFAAIIQSDILRKMFGIFLFILGIYEVLSQRINSKEL